MNPEEIIRDRRDNSHLPTDDDYEQPLTRDALTDANNRFRKSGVPGVIAGQNQRVADSLIKDTAKKRSRAKRQGADDFNTVGEYLEYLNNKSKDVG